MNNSELKIPDVVIVDRDSQQLRLLVSALRSSSYNVRVIENESQVYSRILLQAPDLVLMDVQATDGNNIKTAKLLKENSSTRYVPIIFVSTLTDENDRLLALRAGAVDYILKPYYVDEVLERIRIHIALARNKTDFVRSLGGEAISLNAQLEVLPINVSIKQVATEFILAHISDYELKGSDVAAGLGMSIHRLNMVFEAATGGTVFDFIRKERMERAAKMLVSGSLGVADIAVAVGYPNPSNFSTEFKKFWKKSPNQYRMAWFGDATLQVSQHPELKRDIEAR
ncbi:DNA-binding response OmpR family regulator [Comamonas sp. BIGb0152]|uniref:response regulator transcription factor n=1 Tax=Comamonas sp. BIGb0152 TaxID=2940601 RepID=UPI00216A5C5E|nr:helix-turn-helix domain-containing protein [Comamonas sp. BIGb0152]MCS4296217.1 DNA-binding response OmpR family regulator [Comamonas sp. BIGb0152]